MATYYYMPGLASSQVSSFYTSALMAPCNSLIREFTCDASSRTRNPEDHTYINTWQTSGSTKYLTLSARGFDAAGNELTPSGTYLFAFNNTASGGHLNCHLKLGNASAEFGTPSSHLEDFVRCEKIGLKTVRFGGVLTAAAGQYLDLHGMFYGTFSAAEGSGVNYDIECANYNGVSFSSNLSFYKHTDNSPYLDLDIAQASALASYKKIVVIPVFVAKHHTINFATANADCPVSLESIPIYCDDFGTVIYSLENRGYSDPVELPTPPEPEGWKFLGWSDSTSSGAATYTSISSYPAADKTIYAHWERRTRLDVTFDAQSGYVSPQTKEVYDGLPYGTLPVPRRTGYQFDGWFTAASGGTQVTAASIVDVSQLSQQ